MVLVYWRCKFGFLDKAVAHADHRFDLPSCSSQLSAQAADVHVDRAGFDLSIETPHTLEQAIAGQYAITILDEEAQELELAFGQSDRGARNRY